MAARVFRIHWSFLAYLRNFRRWCNNNMREPYFLHLNEHVNAIPCSSASVISEGPSVSNQIQNKSNHFYCHITTAHVPWWVKFFRACSRQCRNNLHIDSTYLQTYTEDNVFDNGDGYVFSALSSEIAHQVLGRCWVTVRSINIGTSTQF